MGYFGSNWEKIVFQSIFSAKQGIKTGCHIFSHAGHPPVMNKKLAMINRSFGVSLRFQDNLGVGGYIPRFQDNMGGGLYASMQTFSPHPYFGLEMPPYFSLKGHHNIKVKSKLHYLLKLDTGHIAKSLCNKKFTRFCPTGSEMLGKPWVRIFPFWDLRIGHSAQWAGKRAAWLIL